MTTRAMHRKEDCLQSRFAGRVSIEEVHRDLHRIRARTRTRRIFEVEGKPSPKTPCLLIFRTASKPGLQAMVRRDTVHVDLPARACRQSSHLRFAARENS